MKVKLLHHIQQAFGDRAFVLLLGGIVLMSVAYLLSVVLSMRPTDTQIYTHYTAFGEAHFFKGKWYYMISFIIFGIMMVVTHTAIMVRLYTIDRRQTALVFGWMTLLLFVVTWAYTQAVFGIPH